MSLGSNLNVYNTCLLILKEQGFLLAICRGESVGVEVEAEIGEDGYIFPFWVAEKDGARFIANNPIELLGLVEVHNHMQPKENVPGWWKKEGEDLRSKILDEFGG